LGDDNLGSLLALVHICDRWLRNSIQPNFAPEKSSVTDHVQVSSVREHDIAEYLSALCIIAVACLMWLSGVSRRVKVEVIN